MPGVSANLHRRLRRVLRLLERFEPVREDGDTLWDGPFYIPRAGVWWPTSFLRYQNQLFCSVEMGWSRPRLTWTVGKSEIQFEGTPPIGSTVPNDERLWGRVLEQVERRLSRALENEAAFNARVARQLPPTSRTGLVLRKFTWAPRAPPPMSNAQLSKLAGALAQARQAPAMRQLSRHTFLRTAALAYDGAYPEHRLIAPAQKYRRKADGRHGGLLDLGLHDAPAFRRWVSSRKWAGSHPWEIVFAHPHGILLTPRLEEGRWRFWLSAGTVGLYVVTARMAISLGEANVPVELVDETKVLAALRGEDAVEVGPFYGQLSLDELESARPGTASKVVWNEPPRLRLRPVVASGSSAAPGAPNMERLMDRSR